MVGESAIRATGGSGQSGRIGLDLLPVDEQSEEQEVVRELEALVAKMRPELVTIIQAHLSDPDITPKELCAMIGRSKPTLTKLYTTLLNTAVAAGLEPERREQV